MPPESTRLFRSIRDRLRWLLCLSLWVCGPAATADSRLGLAGNEGVVWIHYRRDAGVQQAESAERSRSPLIRLAFCRSARDWTEGWYRPFSISALTGRIELTAVRGSRLHAIFSDGTHRSYGFRDDALEVGLPGSHVPLAMTAGGSTKDQPNRAAALYALVPGDIAQAIAARQRTRELPPRKAVGDPPAARRERQGQEPPGVDDVGSSDQEAWDRSVYALVRFDGSGWRTDRRLPAWFNEPRAVWLSSSGSVVRMVYTVTEPSDGEHLFSVSDSPDQEWSSPEAVPFTGDIEIEDVLTVKGMPAVIIADKGGAAIKAMWHNGEEWIHGGAFEMEGDGAAISRNPVAFGVLGTAIVGAWTDDRGVVYAGRWDLGGGSARATTLAIAALQDRPVTGQRLRSALVGIVLAAVLLVVFVRRRATLLGAPAALDQLKPARFGKRFLAFAIDLSLLLPGMIYIIKPLFRHIDPADELSFLLATTRPEWMIEVLWRWAGSVGLFVVYATLFEWRRGATIGKRLTQCRVVTERGEKCGFLQVMLRNVLRWIEFYPELLPTLVLVLLTRNRQRLGDLIGRTMVVEDQRSTPAPPPTPESN